ATPKEGKSLNVKKPYDS
ncbi:unnamed protein product, partial [Allacma fusca]